MNIRILTIIAFSLFFMNFSHQKKHRFEFYINNVAIKGDKFLSGNVLIFSKGKSNKYQYKNRYNINNIDSIVIKSESGNFPIVRNSLFEAANLDTDETLIKFEYFNKMSNCYFCDSLMKISYKDIVLISSGDGSGFFIYNSN